MKFRLSIYICLLLFFASCNDAPRFVVDGTISGAKDSILYFEHLALKGTQTLDSVRLKENGTFRFSAEPPAYPDLYSLRIARKRLVLAVDSVEHIAVVATVDSLPFAHIDNSPNSLAIVELRRSLRELPRAEHKQIARETILKNPRSIVAYYALFQQHNGFFVFNPYDKADRPYFQAVATSWNYYMPDNERSKALYNLTLDAIKDVRAQENQQALRQFINESENAFLDITLPDHNGETQALSQFRGKVILLDFSTTQMERRTGYVFELRELYNKYHKRGLEIYSVSADNNSLAWANSVSRLPWVNVRGEEGAADPCFRQYNVQQLPTLFLFNKKGEVVRRFSDFEGMADEIEQCLR